MNISKRIKPLEGQTFGTWTVLSFSHIKDNKAKPAYWLCRCDCGKEKAISGSMLRSGRSLQCRWCSAKTVGRIGLNKAAKSHLYVARCGEYFKIGSSDNPERRIKDLQSSCPYLVTCEQIYWDRGTEEGRWLKHHEKQHHRGEWFSGTCEIL